MAVSDGTSRFAGVWGGWRPTILDRYMIAELGGPFAFGLSAFTLIFLATILLSISRLVAEEHAPLGIAIEYFFWQIPATIVTVVPMAMLLGVLLSLQRLSGESEITALKAGGIGLVRAVTPLLLVGLGVSIVALWLQEGLVPIANDRATFLREIAIKKVGVFGGASHTVTTELPAGAHAVTYFAGYETTTQTLLHATFIQYDPSYHPQLIIISDRAHYDPPTWTFHSASEYHFNADGTIQYSQEPEQQVDIGPKPSQIDEIVTNKNREEMSRSQLREVIASGQLTPGEVRAYQTTYEEKLARPFASFVFTLLAVPFGLRPVRGGGGTGLGFGLAVLIVFIYFVIASIISAATTSLPGGFVVSTIGAWLPNLIFVAIGAVLLRRAAAQ